MQMVLEFSVNVLTASYNKQLKKNIIAMLVLNPVKKKLKV